MTYVNRLYRSQQNMSQRCVPLTRHCPINRWCCQSQSNYNKISMAEDDKMKIAFITNNTNYYYGVMPFVLKNVEATYHKLMDKVLNHLIRKNVKVYEDDMVVKSPTLAQHSQDLFEVFLALRSYNLRYMGIEANPEKCQEIIEMTSSKDAKEIQCLIKRLIPISQFLPRLDDETKPMIRLLKKSAKFVWDDACQEIFKQLK